MKILHMEVPVMQIYFILLIVIVIINAIGGDTPSSSYWDENYSQPYFDNTTKRDITVTIGQTALLHCRVRNLGDRAVSWIRKRDLHIMTIGILTYTNDQRYQAIHSEGSDEWSLRVTSAQPRDNGIFECQVSTEPKISQAYRLNVVVSKAKILGNPELYIKSGNDINLTCTISEITNPPSFIYWYKGGRVVNYSQRGGVNVSTDRSTKTSNLIISRATPSDSGNYTCAPSNSDADFVMVHVINNIDPAAMKHGNNSGTSLSISYRYNSYYQHSTFVAWKYCLVILVLINKTFSIR